MNTNFAAITVSLLLTGLPITATAGPFGFDVEGFKLEDYKCDETEEDDTYLCLAPKPHEDLGLYRVHFYESVGVCWIEASTTVITEDPSGVLAREQADSFYRQVSRKYGDGVLYDTIAADSAYKSEENWTDSVVAEDRLYFYLGFPANVDGINLYSVSVSPIGRWTEIAISFSTSNDQCSTADEDENSSVF